MRFQIKSICQLTVLFFLSGGVAVAGPVTHASASLKFTPGSPFGSKADLLPTPVQVFEAAEDGVLIQDAKTWLTEAYNAVTGEVELGTASASWSLGVQKAQLKVDINADLESRFSWVGLASGAYSKIEYQLEWNDSITLQWLRASPKPLEPPHLVMKVRSHAEISGEISLNAIQQTFNRQTFFEGGIYGPAESIEMFGNDNILVPSFEFSAQADSNGKYNPTFLIGGTLTLGAGGYQRIRGGNTFEYASILLPDGTTPESQGWGVVFESGIPSPNVPEPSTSALAMLGACGLAGVVRRRARQSGCR